MKDPAFIQEMILKGRKAGELVQKEFTSLSFEEITTKPSPESWSIAQCFDHLIISDSLFFPAFEKIISGNYHMKVWEKWSPMSQFFGNMMKNHLSEKINRHIKSPKKFLPEDEVSDTAILQKYEVHLEQLLEYIAGFINTDIDKIILSSRVSGFVTYSLRTTIIIILQHQYRHINQAIRTRNSITTPA